MVKGHQTSNHQTTFLGYTFSGWWLTYPSEKYELVSWDDEIPKKLGKTKHQPLLFPQSHTSIHFLDQ